MLAVTFSTCGKFRTTFSRFILTLPLPSEAVSANGCTEEVIYPLYSLINLTRYRSNPENEATTVICGGGGGELLRNNFGAPLSALWLVSLRLRRVSLSPHNPPGASAPEYRDYFKLKP